MNKGNEIRSEFKDRWLKETACAISEINESCTESEISRVPCQFVQECERVIWVNKWEVNCMRHGIYLHIYIYWFLKNEM